MLKKFFSKKKEKEQSQQKSAYIPGTILDDLYSSSSAGSAVRFLDYYRGESIVYTPTNLILDAISSIDIILYNKKDGKFVYDHEVLDRLKQPNPFTSGELFTKSMLLNYIVTGNAYLKIIGGDSGSNDKPSELECLSPRYINIEANSYDGYPETYQYSNKYANDYKRASSNKRFYEDETGNELTQLRNVNPYYNYSDLEGLSFFDAVESEILQYSAANQHNLALLKNQARPSGMLTYVGETGPGAASQLKKIKENIRENLTGPNNTGVPLFLSGDYKFTQLSQTMQDMDFATLKQQAFNSTFNALNIPLPMVASDTMTFSNMDSSKFAFYDNAVLPLFKQYLSFLDYSLLNRYKKKADENLVFSFDPAGIQALEARRVVNALNLSKLDTLTDNEIRTQVGYEHLDQGGNVIYKPINVVPAGTDIYTQDQRDKPAKAMNDKRLDAMAKLHKCKDAQGDDIYSKEEIKDNVVNLFK